MKRIGVWFLKIGMALHILIYRLTDGRRLNVGDRIILLSTIGRRSGQLRTAPLYSVRDGEAYVIIASYGGSPTHPAWYLNLEAHPRALVVHGAHSMPVVAEMVAGDEYTRLWELLVTAYPTYAQYRSRTTRHLPIVRLQPIHYE